jgi:hypothetical protein
LGGEFALLHRVNNFSLNGEVFYPSKSFMYIVRENGNSTYYDIDELALFLEWYGYGVEAEKLRQSVDLSEMVTIARGNYVRGEKLAEAGITFDFGLSYSSDSSDTPVLFNTKG